MERTTETMMNLRVGQAGLGRVAGGAGQGGGGGGGIIVGGNPGVPVEDGISAVAGETSLAGPPSPTGMRYTSDKHPKLALANINMLQKRRELCDVVLIVGARKIFAHRYANRHGASDSFTDSSVLSNPADVQNVSCLGLCGRDICSKN